MVTPMAKPAYVSALEAVFGPPSQAGFGSAVFYTQSEAAGGLEGAAKEAYQHFTGDLWERYGAGAWLRSWQQVYTRPPAAQHAVVAELRRLDDRSAWKSAGVLLHDVEDPQAADSAAFGDTAVTDLAIYKIGDGNALAGLLLAAQRGAGETMLPVFLLD